MFSCLFYIYIFNICTWTKATTETCINILVLNFNKFLLANFVENFSVYLNMIEVVENKKTETLCNSPVLFLRHRKATACKHSNYLIDLYKTHLHYKRKPGNFNRTIKVSKNFSFTTVECGFVCVKFSTFVVHKI